MNGPKSGVEAHKRLLHVNSPAPILRMVERLCQARDFSVDSTESGVVGLHYALARNYRMLILGTHPRGMDPARILRGLERAKSPIRVLMVVDGLSEERNHLESFTRIIGTIAKPLNTQEFTQYLEQARTPPELEAEEKGKLLSVLRKWELQSIHAN